MNKEDKRLIILMADDDDDDYLLTKKALTEAKLPKQLIRVSDGKELLAYLKNMDPYEDLEKYPRPSMILLDLNMPKMDGREVLKQIKADERLREIPVVVFTTSQADEDITRSYQLGGNSFVTKPVTFEALLEVMKQLHEYWFDTVRLPRMI